MSSSNHLKLIAAFLVVCLLFSHSLAIAMLLLPDTAGMSNFDAIYGNYRVREAESGCHFSGTCSSERDCRQPCAALGRNPDAVRCVSSENGTVTVNRCCCIDSS